MGTWVVWLGVSLAAWASSGTTTPWSTETVGSCRIEGAATMVSHSGEGGAPQLRLDKDERGTVRLLGSADDLRFEQRVFADRRIEFSVRRGADAVGLTLDRGKAILVRGGRSVSVGANEAQEQHWLAAQQLLAGSPAVFRFRRFVAALPAERRRTMEGAAVLLADAALGTLAGDTLASDHLVDRLRSGRPSVRRAAFEEEKSCYEKWEAQAIRTWEDYKLCIVEAWWIRDLCSWRFILMAESNWFELLGCIAFPIKVE
jgi:hypothetical protein